MENLEKPKEKTVEGEVFRLRNSEITNLKLFLNYYIGKSNIILENKVLDKEEIKQFEEIIDIELPITFRIPKDS